MDVDEKPPLFEWNTMWRGTMFGVVLVILIIAGLFIEKNTSVLYGKGDFLDFAGRLSSLKVPLKWG